VILTDAIRQIHAASNGIYGARRVHAELTLGRGIQVWHGTVSMLMARDGLRGVAGRARWHRPHPDLIAADLVDRQFRREGIDQLWVTDITEHPTRARSTAPSSWTPAPGGSWGGPSTPHRPPLW